MIWILFYYNSLPDMPEECRLFSSEIMHRDFFKCNPTNTGHYQYPKFEKLSYDEGCHKEELNSFLAKDDPEKYVVFYTRHTGLPGTGEKNNKIVGFYQVGRCFNSPKKGFCASKSVLLPKTKCIAIDYNSRGVPVSWGKSSIKEKVGGVLKNLKRTSINDISSQYKSETQKIMKKLQSPAGRQQIISICNKCKVRGNCFWGKKEDTHKAEKIRELYTTKDSC